MILPPTNTHPTVTRDGVALCARYAFGPNRLHLCGPDLNKEVLDYINAGAVDTGLTNIISRFQTLFPYLQQISQANNIKDPFDHRVVEAYWLGNGLLDAIPAKTFYHHLTDGLSLTKQLPHHAIDRLKGKLSQGALMHHSFHVLNIWRRTGHHDVDHTLSSLDQCLISWGQVTAIDGPVITILRPPLTLHQQHLTWGPPIRQSVARPFTAATTFDRLQVGDTLSLHWGIPCDIISPRQRANLIKYTNLSLHLANQTL